MINLDPATISPATLEAYIDASSLQSVIRLLACIARAKADHIVENWQDSSTAKRWERAATKLERLNLDV